MAEGCTHIADADDVEPNTTEGCEACLAAGDTDWTELRVCVECGHVGCCGSSLNEHARKHFEETGHPVIQPLDGDWLWCYEDETYD